MDGQDVFRLDRHRKYLTPLGQQKPRFAFVETYDFYAGKAQRCLDGIFILQPKALALCKYLSLEPAPLDSLEQRRGKRCVLRERRAAEVVLRRGSELI